MCPLAVNMPGPMVIAIRAKIRSEMCFMTAEYGITYVDQVCKQQPPFLAALDLDSLQDEWLGHLQRQIAGPEDH